MIKFVKLTTLLLLALIISFSCSKNEQQRSTAEKAPEAAYDSDKIRDFLVNDLQLNPEELEEREESFIYQHDIEFPKANFWEDYGNVDFKAKHRKSSYKVNPTGTAYVYFNAGVPSSWKTQMLNAMSEWNALGGPLAFYEYVYPYTNTGIGVINVRYEDFGSGDENVFARAGFPKSSGSIHKEIKINSGYTGTTLYNSHKKKVSAHELGHCIGFCHTNTSDGSLLYTGNYACDTYDDSQSIMRQGRISWAGFSTCDELAYEALY